MTTAVFRMEVLERARYAMRYAGKRVAVLWDPTRHADGPTDTFEGVLVSVGHVPGRTGFVVVLDRGMSVKTVIPLSQVRSIEVTT
jgi:ribosomal protein L21E